MVRDNPKDQKLFKLYSNLAFSLKSNGTKGDQLLANEKLNLTEQKGFNGFAIIYPNFLDATHQGKGKSLEWSWHRFHL